MDTRRIIIEFEDDSATIIYEGIKLTQYIAKFNDKSGKFTIHNEVNKDIINVVADSLLIFGNWIKSCIKSD